MAIAKWLIIVLCAFIGLSALLYGWVVLENREKIEISPAVKQIVMKDGIHGEIAVFPESPIIPGEIVQISINIFFDPTKVQVDEARLAERYIELKERHLAGCEERTSPKIRLGSRNGVSNISIASKFQCWSTRKEYTTLTIPVIHQNEGGTNTLYTSRRLYFNKIDASEGPRPLAHTNPEHKEVKGWVAIILGLALTAAILAYCINTLKKKPKTTTEGLPGWRTEFLRDLAKLESEACLQRLEAIYDKAYHICLMIEKFSEPSEKTENAKRILADVYDQGVNLTNSRFLWAIGQLKEELKQGGNKE